MKRFYFIFLVLFTSIVVYGQSSMTDTQVMDFVMKEQSKGSSQTQIVTKLIQNGVDITQIRRVKSSFEKMKKGNANMGSTQVKDGDRSRTNNGQTTPNADKKAIESKTLQNYNEDEKEAELYSNNRIKSNRKVSKNTFDEEDTEFLLMKEEMDGWLLQDTAAMYKQLVKELDKKKKKVWGRDIFNNKNLSFEPNMNLPLPKNYILGAGDEVFIDIYGASQKTIQTTVAPDGIITIEGFGPIQVSGLTVQQANNRLTQKIGKRYSSSSIRLSVGQTHTISVNVVGEVKTPGTYTLSAFATVFNALYMAGGISELGTLRNIQVYRRGKLISVVDVYDFLKKGDLSGNVHLTDNDVIVVGAYDMLVNLTGKVKRPMFYEMKRNENLSTLLNYAGGFAGGAYSKAVKVLRKSGRQHAIYTVNEFDFSKFRLSDADSIHVDSVISRYENMVEIKGAVFRPGMYEVGGSINSVKSLIEAAEGITEYAFTNHAVMHRLKADRSLEAISVDVDGILLGKVADIPLQNEDVLFIPTRTDVQEEKTISIHGEVQYPGIYKYAENETIEDFILQAGGLTNKASTVRVDVSRRIFNPQALAPDSILAQSFSFSIKDGFVIDGQPGFTLAPYDEVFVRKSPGTKTLQNVIIEGEVIFAGKYTLTAQNTRLSDIFKATGGATELAYIQGARLERKPNEVEKLRMEAAYKTQLELENKAMLELAASNANGANIQQAAKESQKTNLQKFQVPEYYPVGIELDKAIANPGSDADLILREGDKIIVPQYNGTVKINGAVMYPNSVVYRKGKSVSYYIDQAGGFATDAKRSQTYILYMNGTMAKVGNKAKVMPGCEIIVPTKSKGKMSLAEIMAMGSSAGSMAAVLATLASLLK